MKYVVSDIHGDYERWSEMLNKIELISDDRLIVLGDVIDRGPDGIKIIKEIMDSKNIKMILGNHELMMLYAVSTENESYVEDWFNNGGYETAQNFSKESEESQEKILNFIRTRRYKARTKTDDGRVFSIVHGWPCESEILNDEIYNCVWTRPNRTEKPSIACEGQLIIGHTPVNELYTKREIKDNGHPRILYTPYYIDIDCGCGHHGGCLSALCLDTMEEFYVL